MSPSPSIIQFWQSDSGLPGRLRQRPTLWQAFSGHGQNVVGIVSEDVAFPSASHCFIVAGGVLEPDFGGGESKSATARLEVTEWVCG